MEYSMDVKNVSLKYKKFNALKDISFKLEDQKIYGFIGRNGAGKTSLLSLLSALREASEGSITIDEEEVFENSRLMESVIFVHETDYKEEDKKVDKILSAVAKYRPNYDPEYAEYLIKRFKLPKDKGINKMSKGMQSVLDVIIGLSSRAPITIFDEAYLGMDAPTRVIFYQELLEEQGKHPRIMILSTHLVSEMDYLFDEVLILHQGKLLLKEEYETLLLRGLTLTGSSKVVDELVQGKKILRVQKLGDTKAVSIYEENTEKVDEIEKQARQKGVDVGPMSLQDLFIYLTEDEPV